MIYAHNTECINDKKFSSCSFKNPPTDFYPTYSWAWNAPINKKEIINQLDAMYENNIRIIYILPEPRDFRPDTNPTTLEPDYLTEEYFELYRYAAEYAAGKGMQMWLYDEGGWPSGSANGQVTKKKPHLLNMHIEKHPVSSPYVPSHNAIAAFCAGIRIKPGFASEEEIYEYTAAYGPGKYPNLAEAEATDDFINLTHEKYKKHLCDMFGSIIKVAFTDEPQIYAVPWCRSLAQDFEEKYGYDIRDFIPDVMRECESSDNGKRATRDYYNLVSELFAKNYFEKLRTWCRQNNIASSGHLNGEHETLGCIKYGFYHVMRQLRCFDIPGIDTIWRQIFPGQENHFFPRFASSAANQIGAPYAVSESFAIYGSGLTFDQMRYVMMYQMVRGINLINIMNTTYCYDGFYMAGGRPSFMPLIPAWRHLGEYNIYAARMSYVMSLGKPATCHALYMPMNDFWIGGSEAFSACDSFDGIARYLEKHHCPFDIIDDDFLETAEIKNGCITTGTAAYEAVIIPECRPLPPESKKVLDRFALGGGTLMASNELDRIKPAAKISSDKISVHKKLLDNGVLYLLVNEGTEKESFCAYFPEDGNVYELHADSGDIVPAVIPEVTLESGEGRVYIISDEDFGFSVAAESLNHCEELTEFEVRKTYGFKIGEQKFEPLYYTDDYVRCVLGDWRSIFGDDFSGIAEYRTHFSLSQIPEALQIDLGRVNYSCEVFLNGRNLGICCMSPYRYIAEKSLLKNENELVISIANTPANQYVTTNSIDKWKYEVVGPYHKIAKEFEYASMESGLFGPVIIRY